MTDDGNTLSGARQPDPTGLAGCRVEARLALGNGTRVYRAVDVAQSRTVALKMLTTPLTDEPNVIERFLVAASALVGLSHDNVVTVLRAGRDGHVPYCVLEYVEGEDLERRLARRGTMSPGAALAACIDALRGLEAAAERGVLHGDVRPGHLLSLPNELVKLTGFGLSPPFTTAHGRHLSGSPAYMAPEACAGDPIDLRSDLYSLGCTLYELLTGRPPFGLGGPDALVACHVHEPFPALLPNCPKATPELEAFVQRLVAKRPDKRFSSHDEAARAGARLLPALRDAPPQPPALFIDEGRQAGLRMEIPEGETLLGRVPGEGLALDDGRVSRRHAMIRRAGGYIEIADLDSRNGIRVNHIEVKSKQLFHGDRIGIGDTVLRIEAAEVTGALLPQRLVQVPDSPIRGAFGDVEVSHAPNRQATADALWPCSDLSELGARVALLAAVAPALSSTVAGPRALRDRFVAAAVRALHADAGLYVPITGGAVSADVGTAGDAAILSTALPALERALPGALSLATTVRRDRDQARAVLLAPVRRGGATVAYLLVSRDEGRFSAQGLTLLEAAASLLSARAEVAPDPV